MLKSLEPFVDDDSRVLILGSMPGTASLAAAEYYHHPQNRFWRILFAFFGEPYTRDYAARLGLCRRKGIALWDAVGACERVGSLDASITSVVPNDIDGLLRRYPRIAAVLCNGRASEKYCRKYNKVVPVYLPSTSPLNAGGDPIAVWTEKLRALFD